VCQRRIAVKDKEVRRETSVTFAGLVREKRPRSGEKPLFTGTERAKPVGNLCPEAKQETI